MSGDWSSRILIQRSRCEAGREGDSEVWPRISKRVANEDRRPNDKSTSSSTGSVVWRASFAFSARQISGHPFMLLIFFSNVRMGSFLSKRKPSGAFEMVNLIWKPNASLTWSKIVDFERHCQANKLEETEWINALQLGVRTFFLNELFYVFGSALMNPKVRSLKLGKRTWGTDWRFQQGLRSSFEALFSEESRQLLSSWKFQDLKMKNGGDLFTVKLNQCQAPKQLDSVQPECKQLSLVIWILAFWNKKSNNADRSRRLTSEFWKASDPAWSERQIHRIQSIHNLSVKPSDSNEQLPKCLIWLI